MDINVLIAKIRVWPQYFCKAKKNKTLENLVNLYMGLWFIWGRREVTNYSQKVTARKFNVETNDQSKTLPQQCVGRTTLSINILGNPKHKRKIPKDRSKIRLVKIYKIKSGFSSYPAT